MSNLDILVGQCDRITCMLANTRRRTMWENTSKGWKGILRRKA